MVVLLLTDKYSSKAILKKKKFKNMLQKVFGQKANSFIMEMKKVYHYELQKV